LKSEYFTEYNTALTTPTQALTAEFEDFILK